MVASVWDLWIGSRHPPEAVGDQERSGMEIVKVYREYNRVEDRTQGKPIYKRQARDQMRTKVVGEEGRVLKWTRKWGRISGKLCLCDGFHKQLLKIYF